MNESIIKTIQDYMMGKEAPSSHDVLCFVGMIETGEATLADFTDAGVSNAAVELIAETLYSFASK